MEEQVEQIVAEVFGLAKDEINNDISMQQLEVWDSLKHMELIVAIEEAFQLKLSFDDIVKMQNVLTIKEILQEKQVTV